LQLAVQFNAARHFLVGFHAHNGKVALTVFGNKDRLVVGMAVRGNVIVVVSQICAGTNVRHK
jgi:hypothetical protein